jgi:gentisate 1,2-dioxygenase
MNAPAFNSARDDYHGRLSSKHITPLWTVTAQTVPPEPKPACEPVHWDYRNDIRPLINEAANLISAKEAQRRVLILNNPSLGRGATRTLICAVQLIKPGEIAPAHRHTQSAIRFIIEGSGAYTAVDGQKTYMQPGDLIVTPAWAWHEHGSESETPTIWLDGLDIPLVNHLGATFAEDEDEPQQFRQRPAEDSRSRYGAGLLPLEPMLTSRYSPLFSYPYLRVREAFEALRRADDWDAAHGLKLKYANPLNGNFVLPTIAAYAQLVPKGFRTIPYRSTESAVVMVKEGCGRAVIGSLSYDLKQHDIFVVPNWTWLNLEADDDLMLLSFSDRAALENLGLWRDQRRESKAA